MIDELLNLWVVRLAKQQALPVPDPATQNLARLVDDPRSNVLVSASSLDAGRTVVVDALRQLAYRDADLDDQAEEVTGWLVVDVPIPNHASPEELVHRMIRRLYFAAVLHGLAEVPALRDAVQSLRLSYLQTRGAVTTSQSSELSGKLEAGLSFDLTQPIKLTASEELKVAESLSATMDRMNMLEAEDQLVYDLHILMQLNSYITSYAEVVGRTLPRWEHVRGFFKACYARLRTKKRFRLRPLFVLEATSLGAATSLLGMFSRAAAMAAAQGAQLVVIGGPALVRAHELDQGLGHGVFRGQFQVYGDAAAPADALLPVERRVVEALLAREPKPDPAVAAILEAMRDETAIAPVGGQAPANP